MNEDKQTPDEIEAGQGERLTVRLKGIIRAYPRGPGIIQEFIQNADDAMATEVRIVLDRRNHPTDKLSVPEESLWAGPSLIVANDAAFTSRDFEALQTIGESSKFRSGLKTGRFGIGFNSVYNITDYPSVVSADRLLFFDPHRRHPLAKKDKAGGGWLLKAKHWETYPDLLAFFEPGGLRPGTEHHKGTIFRLPIRDLEQARNSDICSQPFTPEDFHSIISDVVEVSGEMLLFLKSVRSLQVDEIDANGARRNLLSVTTTNVEEVRQAREQVNIVANNDCSQILKQLRKQPADAPSTVFTHHLLVRYEGKERHESWRVATGLYVDPDAEVVDAAEAVIEHEGKALPWAGAAVRLGPIRNGNRQVVPIDGRLYCFLPLPITTKLKAHINGYFDVASSRDSLTHEPKNSARVEWNRQLLRHSVSRAYAALLASLISLEPAIEPAGYYAIWPDSETPDGLIAEVGSAVYEHLENYEVIKTVNDEWRRPTELLFLPSGWSRLQGPLVAQGFTIPNPPLPSYIFDGLKAANIELDVLDPATLRGKLRMDHDLDTPPDKAPDPWLRKRGWLVALLQFCLSDGVVSDLAGLPLGLLDDGRLHTFGHSIYNHMFLATPEQKNLFPNCPNWFLDSEYAKECGLSAGHARIVSMEPGHVLGNLSTILGRSFARAWNPKGNDLPNENWLIRVFEYLTLNRNAIASSLRQTLQKVPCIPNQNGELCAAGLVSTPLLPARDLRANPQLRFALDTLGVPRVEGTTPLIQALHGLSAAFGDQGIVRPLDGPNLVEALTATKAVWEPKFTKYEPKIHDVLLTFLSDPLWNEEYDSELLADLASLKILPTVNGELVSAKMSGVYLPSGFEPPDIGAAIRIVATDRGKWTRFIERLELPLLDAEAFIFRLLSMYPKLESRRLVALEWLQANLSIVQKDLRHKSVERAHLLQEAVADAPLVECDGRRGLHAPREVYHPDLVVIRKVLGDTVAYPNLNVYSQDKGQWIRFFLDLGMQTEPRAEDLLKFIDDLRSRSAQDGVEAVADALRTVFAHIVEHWGDLASVLVEETGGRRISFANALGARDWLPAQRGGKLDRFFAASQPDNRLFRPSELYPARLGHLVASQAAIFDFIEPDRVVRDALGFPKSVTLDRLLNHFDRVIEEYDRADKPLTVPTKKAFLDSVIGVYAEIGRVVSDGTDGEIENSGTERSVSSNEQRSIQRQQLVARYAGRPCLWHRETQRFLPPEKCFRFNAAYLVPYRFQIKSVERADLGLVALGRHEEPTLEDLAQCIDEIAAEFDGPLDDVAAAIVLKVFAQMGRLLLDSKEVQGRECISNVLVLTTTQKLMPPDAVLESDDPRIEQSFTSDQLHLLHPGVDPTFAEAAGVLRLSSVVTERLLQTPTALEEGRCVEDCQRLAGHIRTPEFFEGVIRLVRAQHGRGCRVGLEWLKRVDIVPVCQIQTTLMLVRRDGFTLDGPGTSEFYWDDKNSRIYLADQADSQDEAFCFAHAVNRGLGDRRLGDVSHLSRILSMPPERIAAWLTKKGIPRLVDATFDTHVDFDGEDAEFEEMADEGVAADNEPPVAEKAVGNGDSKAPESTLAAPKPGGNIDEPAKEAPKDAKPVQNPGETTKGNEPIVDDSQTAKAEKPQTQETSSIGANSDRLPPVAERPDHPLSPAASVDSRSGRSHGQRFARGPVGVRSPGDATRQLGAGIGSPRPKGPNIRKGRFVTYVAPEGQNATPPDSSNDEQPQNMKIGNAAVEAVIESEPSGWRIERKAHNHPGYDLISTSSDERERRYIEVKGIEGGWNTLGVPVSKRQLETAQKLGDEFWLYVVEFACEPAKRRIYRIQNPYDQITEFRFDNGWSSVAISSKSITEATGSIPAGGAQTGSPRIFPGEPKPGEKVRLKDRSLVDVVKVFRERGKTMLMIKDSSGRKRALAWPQSQ